MGTYENLTTSVLEGRTVSRRREHVSVDVMSVDASFSTEFSAWVLPSVTSHITTIDWNACKLQWDHLRDIDFPEVRGQVDVLIGLNAIDLHKTYEERSGRSDHHTCPVARLTPLGWVCIASGLACQESATFMVTGSAGNPEHEDLGATSPSLEQLVERLWRDESVGVIQDPQQECNSVCDVKAASITSKSLTYQNGRFQVGITWIHEDGQPHVTSNRPQAERRLYALENSLDKRPAVKAQYVQVMKGHQEKGYVSRVSADDVEQDGMSQWYLPHFPIVREDKSTTKVRIVFDAAAQWDGKSINDEMFTGPALQNNLVQILMKFCLEPVALVGDISEMFLQVGLLESDRKFHRFLWRSENGQVDVYQFNRLVFGIKASPYLAGRAVKEVVQLFGGDYSPKAVAALDHCMYVDDLLCSLPNVEAAVNVREHLQNLLRQGGFHMRKWLSNSSAVLGSVPVEDRAVSTSMFLRESEDSTMPVVKTLGVCWLAEADMFTFRYDTPVVDKITRRSVLRGLASLYDPRGQIAPFTVRSKIMLQDSWLLGLQWDDELPEDHVRSWRRWFDEFPTLSDIAAPRCFKDAHLPAADAQLAVHTFSDASDRAIAAVSYVRAEYPTGEVKVTLAFARAKPAPVRKQTIPQLELRAAVLGTRVSSQVATALAIPLEKHIFWTDSMNVLGWIRAHSRRFKVDIANRVSELQSTTRPEQWHHVPGKYNPADKATRGLRAGDLAVDLQWWNGPTFLSEPVDVWPDTKTCVSVKDLLGNVSRQGAGMTLHVSKTPKTLLDASHFSSWERLTRVTAWCLRFVGLLTSRQSAKKGDDSVVSASVDVLVGANGGLPNKHQPGRGAKKYAVPELSPDEVHSAELYWVANAQAEVYPDSVSLIKTGQSLPANDPLFPLNPVIDDSGCTPVLRLGGRLKFAEHLPKSLRSPILLPARHPVSKLIIMSEDQRCGHTVGSHHLLANIRQRFWLVNGLQAIKRVRKDCAACCRNSGQPATQLMGPLPNFRTAGSLKPFSHIGIDYAGPFSTKLGRGRTRAKHYLCLFTCLETRACHLEMAYSLDTDSFLLAFSRFVMILVLESELPTHTTY